MLSADDRLALINVKVERAKHHVDDLHTEIRAFFATNPYGVVKKIDSQTGKMRYEVARAQSPAPAISAVCGDIFQNLRSALDHLTNQLLMKRLGVSSTNQEFNFSVFGNENAHKAYFGRVEEKGRIDAEAFEALRSLKAYRGGDGHDFWLLNRLNNIDKHRMIIAVGSASHSVNIGAAMWSRMVAEMPSFKGVPPIDVFVTPANNLCPLKIGDVLTDGLTPDMEMNEERDFTFEIALNEPQVVEGKPLVETAQKMLDLVAGTVLSFKKYLV